MDDLEDLDCSGVLRQLWLVKVPKYVSSRFKKSKRLHVGKFVFSDDSTKIKFVLEKKITKMKIQNDDVPIPEEMTMNLHSEKAEQSMYIFSKCDGQTMKIEGHVNEKFKCTPIVMDEAYMDLERQLLERAENNSAHKETKMLTIDEVRRLVLHYQEVSSELQQESVYTNKPRDEVVDMMFEAYKMKKDYRLNEMAMITNQQPYYLKKLLAEYCQFNSNRKWELKSEHQFTSFYKSGNGDEDDSSTETRRF